MFFRMAFPDEGAPRQLGDKDNHFFCVPNKEDKKKRGGWIDWEHTRPFRCGVRLIQLSLGMMAG